MLQTVKRFKNQEDLVNFLILNNIPSKLNHRLVIEYRPKTELSIKIRYATSTGKTQKENKRIIRAIIKELQMLIDRSDREIKNRLSGLKTKIKDEGFLTNEDLDLLKSIDPNLEFYKNFE